MPQLEDAKASTTPEIVPSRPLPTPRRTLPTGGGDGGASGRPSDRGLKRKYKGGEQVSRGQPLSMQARLLRSSSLLLASQK